MHWFFLVAVLVSADYPPPIESFEPVSGSELKAMFSEVRAETDPTSEIFTEFRSDGQVERQGRFRRWTGRFSVEDGRICTKMPEWPDSCWNIVRSTEGQLFIIGDTGHPITLKLVPLERR